MTYVEVECVNCKKRYKRELRRFNEAKKFGWHFYCSRKCLGLSRKKLQTYQCSNPACQKTFERYPKESSYTKNNYYCSRSCASIINNTKHPKRSGPLPKKCIFCEKMFTGNGLLCSRKCRNGVQTINKQEILDWINQFYKKEHRVPLKREYLHAKAARLRFGTWNKAVEASGYKPNPVMFANKYFANDGHKCDSLAEKIIDDWLFARKIPHKRTVPYPKAKKLTADFVINNYWVEFFGLAGEHKAYDKLVRKKLYLVKKNHLKFIQILPKHLFPKNKLESIFKPIYVK